jgi:hypothetical protein
MNTAKICRERIGHVNWGPRFADTTRCDKRRGHDADDGVHVAAEWNRFTENLLVTVELLHPQVVT